MADVLNPAVIEEIITTAQARAAATDAAGALAAIAARIADTQRAILALLDLAEHGAALAEVRSRLRQREAELTQLRQQEAQTISAQRAVSAEALRGALATLATDLHSENIPLARRALARVVAAVELRDYAITVRYR